MSDLIKLPAALALADCFSAPPPPLDFVLPGLVAGTVGALVSPGATGKSFWALEIGAAVAGDGDLLGLGIQKKGNVLVVAAEDPSPVLQARLHDLGKLLSPDAREQLIERLDVMPAMSAGIDLFGADAMQWVKMIIERGQNCRLIIIDTLSRVHTGEENERKDAARVMRFLERIAAATGAAVIFLHHITKSVALGGQGDQQQAARGSSVWIDEARWAGFLKTMDPTEAKGYVEDEDLRRNFVRYGVNKANYCAPILDIWLRRDLGGVLVPAELVKGIPSEKREERKATQSRAQRLANKLGMEVCDDPDSL